MTLYRRIGLAGWLWVCLFAPAVAGEPLRLHPDNPHYFLFRGKPAVLITSGEHYGAVLNRDFDYVRYLDALAADGLNLTRTFSGAYVEVPSSFGIVNNTLAPAQDRFLAPWARSETAGPAAIGRKFDLEKWDPAYFQRLKDFVAQAGKRGIVVEFVFFSAIYDDALWAINPLNPANNVNEIPPLGRLQVFTLQNKRLSDFQAALIRKIAGELGDADNVYFEICNEPYFGGVTAEWNDRMISVLAEAEKRPAARHLIAQNIANGSVVVKDPNPGVSILNFHYSIPPDSVEQNYGLGRAIGDDETGFRGTADVAYRTEGWAFVVAGGAVYDNLDYSFSVQHPAGTQPLTTSPGGGGAPLRKQLGALKKFMDGFDFPKMKPDNDVIVGGVPEKGSVRVLAEASKQYAIYVQGGTKNAEGTMTSTLQLKLPRGSYQAKWVDTKSGETIKAIPLDHGDGPLGLVAPDYTDDIALAIRAR